MGLLHWVILAICAAPAVGGWTEDFTAGKVTVVDLTHTLQSGMPSLSNQPNYLQEVTAKYERGFAMNSLIVLEHAGTHADAPSHFAEVQSNISAVPAKALVIPGIVVDFRRQAADPDAQLAVEDLLVWEKSLGRIPNGAAVLLWTGWSDRWGEPDRYRNEGSNGILHFPGFSKEAAEWLLTERKIAWMGTDTLSGDAGSAMGGAVFSTSTAVFPVHRLVSNHGKYLLENLTGLEALPPRDFWVVVGVLKVGGGTGAPARILALIPKG